MNYHWIVLVVAGWVIFLLGVVAGKILADHEATRERRRKRAEEHEEYLRREGKIT